MPSGNVHNLINTAAYAALFAATALAQHAGYVHVTPVQGLAFTAGYAAGTFLLSPDLDLAEGRVNSKRYWGILGFLWVPYGMLFSHRGLSHTWLIGPLTRLAYLGVIVALVVGLVAFLVPDLRLPGLPSSLDWKGLLPLLAGYYLSQWMHLIADGVRPDHDLRHARKTARRTFKRLR
ncbi:metal-binding protein [Deinococcus maricopensis]|uniref:Hydrolase n=1 Tax=Deinococcus maricopensis (strain DSM 21211 / LMG 22137 / NRRL B-23946 / LB-34) TaxID=709986 RepID=E8UBR4_DEIML|nr:metal-binding protein [Deinococcus maricopensis]ADV68503.1 Protein of unknown function DUF2227, metal-binding protein [Deinococcus maricopensis DSM 21211]